jgi:NitT/TauT family transport system substrate-binding protein
MRRHQFLSTVAAPAIVATIAPATFARADGPLNVGITNAISDAPFFIAQDRGFFKEQGLDVQFVPFDSAAKMIAPLGTGQLDVGGGAPSAALYNAIESGITIKVVADKGTTAPGYGYNPLLVRKALVDSGRVKNIRDLKGLTLADAAQGSASTSTLNEALKSDGLTLADIKNVKMGFPDMVAALKSGAIDGGIVSEPAASEAVGLGVAVKLAASDTFYPNQQIAVLLYGGAFMKSSPEAARKFMLAYIKALRFYADALHDGHFSGQNAPAVIDILRKNTALKDPRTYTIITPNGVNPNGSVNQASMAKDLDLMRSQGFVTGKVTVRQAVDASYVNGALRTLGRVQT